MENTGSKLATIVDEISELEIEKSELLFAKFQNSLNESYEEKIKIVENDFLGKANLYGKTINDCTEVKNSIISKYDKEFQKIFESRKVQYISIQNEIQELTANKLIVIANFKQIAKEKSKFIENAEYKEYLNKREKFINIINNTENKEEQNEYIQLLNNLENPLNVFQKKLEALAVKYDSYEETINVCLDKLEECRQTALSEFTNIVKYIDNSLDVVKNENIFVKFINKIINKFSGNSKFEKNVIQKMQNELNEIDKETDDSIENIDEQTINLIAAIEDVRVEIKNDFDVAVG